MSTLFNFLHQNPLNFVSSIKKNIIYVCTLTFCIIILKSLYILATLIMKISPLISTSLKKKKKKRKRKRNALGSLL